MDVVKFIQSTSKYELPYTCNEHEFLLFEKKKLWMREV